MADFLNFPTNEFTSESMSEFFEMKSMKSFMNS